MYNPNRYDSRTFLLYIEACQQGDFAGHFFNPCTGDSGTFSCLSQLIMKVDRCLDINNAPQAFHAVRSFIPNRPIPGVWSEEIRFDPDRLASFSLHILFRRNASWQGTLTWLEQGQAQRFRSALELMALISSAAEAFQHTDGWLPHFFSSTQLTEALEG